MKKKKIDAGDTIKRLPDEPKDAIRDDYGQTKADMNNLKEKLAGDGGRDEDEDR